MSALLTRYVAKATRYIAWRQFDMLSATTRYAPDGARIYNKENNYVYYQRCY